MRGKHTSRARGVYRIPQWEHPGLGFMENAKKRLLVRFDLEMEAALNNMPARIFMDNLKTR